MTLVNVGVSPLLRREVSAGTGTNEQPLPVHVYAITVYGRLGAIWRGACGSASTVTHCRSLAGVALAFRGVETL